MKLVYSSFHNITFTNDYCPDYIDLPDDWDEWSAKEQDRLIDEEIEAYMWELVEIDATVVDGEDEEED